jgi:hypothetical protein
MMNENHDINMKGICVATDDSRAYYSVLSRLRNTDLRFTSVNPSDALKEQCDLIVTTRDESRMFTGRTTVAIEDLDRDPLIMKGQILSMLSSNSSNSSNNNKNRDILIGIDPGSRIGLAIYYGDRRLAALTFNSIDNLMRFIVRTVGAIPNSSVMIKIGDGSPRLSSAIAQRVAEEVSVARIEVVDEKGTSVSRSEDGGLKRDQNAAAKIALRKGILYEHHH